jgi:hypothetical protein
VFTARLLKLEFTASVEESPMTARIEP